MRGADRSSRSAIAVDGSGVLRSARDRRVLELVEVGPGRAGRGCARRWPGPRRRWSGLFMRRTNTARSAERRRWARPTRCCSATAASCSLRTVARGSPPAMASNTSVGGARRWPPAPRSGPRGPVGRAPSTWRASKRPSWTSRKRSGKLVAHHGADLEGEQAGLLGRVVPDVGLALLDVHLAEARRARSARPSRRRPAGRRARAGGRCGRRGSGSPRSRRRRWSWSVQPRPAGGPVPFRRPGLLGHAAEDEAEGGAGQHVGGVVDSGVDAAGGDDRGHAVPAVAPGRLLAVGQQRGGGEAGAGVAGGEAGGLGRAEVEGVVALVRRAAPAEAGA